MQALKPVGRNAAALKYDILSALGVKALAGDKHHQRLTLRLMVLITTRYNWQTNALSIGRAEMARLWSVDERTVKRDLAKLRALGWLVIKRAGVKGRVTVYELDLTTLLDTTRDVWPALGRDFEARMADTQPPPPDPQSDPNVIPFQTRAASVGQGGTWGAVLAELERRDPAQTKAWFAQLVETDRDAGSVTLCAPSRFVADYVRTHLATPLLAAWSRHDSSVRDLRIIHAAS